MNLLFSVIFLIFSSFATQAIAQQEVAWDPAIIHDVDIVIGEESAPITVIEYASLTCPHCQRFHSVEFPLFKKGWIDTGKVKFVFRSLPLDQSALAGAMVVSCSPKDAQFDVIDTLFLTAAEWAPDTSQISAVMSKGVLDGRVDFNALSDCISDGELPTKIMTPVTEALENGIRATPSFVINGKIITGYQSAEALGKIVNEAISDAILP